MNIFQDKFSGSQFVKPNDGEAYSNNVVNLKEFNSDLEQLVEHWKEDYKS